MFQPVGSLPPKVYWRRRVVVAVAAIVVIFLISTMFGGDDGANAGKAGHQAARTSAAAHPTPTGSHPATPGGGPSGQAAGSPSGSGSGAPASPTGSGQPSGTCADSDLRLVASTDETRFPAGTPASVRLTITNTSSKACTRDVGAAQQEAIVSRGDERIWSSDDCSPGGSADVRTLQPGETLHFAVTWPGRRSQPHCAGGAATAPSGDYTVVARLGGMHSAPAAFTLTGAG